jgi:hypothetical protein
MNLMVGDTIAAQFIGILYIIQNVCLVDRLIDYLNLSKARGAITMARSQISCLWNLLLWLGPLVI